MASLFEFWETHILSKLTAALLEFGKFILHQTRLLLSLSFEIQIFSDLTVGSMSFEHKILSNFASDWFKFFKIHNLSDLAAVFEFWKFIIHQTLLLIFLNFKTQISSNLAVSSIEILKLKFIFVLAAGLFEFWNSN